MSLRSEYDVWHRRNVTGDAENDDASSPWYGLVREKIGNVAGKRILEVACGRGGYVSELTFHGATVFGCDFSLAALSCGNLRLQKLENRNSSALVQTDAHHLPFSDASFDLIVSCETIEHLPDVMQALREMWRVARDGAILYLTTPNYANLMGLYDLYAKLRHPHRKDDQPFDRRQWFLQVRKWVKGTGWTILASDGAVHQLPIIPGRNPLSLPFLESNRMVRRLLSPVAYHYFISAEKRK